MAKGFWIAHVDVTDAEGFKTYQAMNGGPIAEFGGRFIVRGGESSLRAGTLRSRHVVVEFPTYEAAVACYESPGYKEAIVVRDKTSDIDIVIVAGTD